MKSSVNFYISFALLFINSFGFGMNYTPNAAEIVRLEREAAEMRAFEARYREQERQRILRNTPKSARSHWKNSKNRKNNAGRTPTATSSTASESAEKEMLLISARLAITELQSRDCNQKIKN